jgi:hypothetical protein
MLHWSEILGRLLNYVDVSRGLVPLRHSHAVDRQWERHIEKKKFRERRRRESGGGVVRDTTVLEGGDRNKICGFEGSQTLSASPSCRVEAGAAAMEGNVVWHWEGYIRAKFWKVHIWKAAREAFSATWNLPFDQGILRKTLIELAGCIWKVLQTFVDRGASGRQRCGSPTTVISISTLFYIYIYIYIYIET